MANAEQFYDVIRRPLMTEKSSGAQETGNKFTFEVSNEFRKTKTEQARVAFVKTLAGETMEDGTPCVGESTCFVSHACRGLFLDLCRCIISWA